MVPRLHVLEKTVKLIDRVYDCLVIGTGAAGYNAAVHLVDSGVENIAIISEDRFRGTSRNTGSDKQTYYKVACAGAEGDSPRSMAETLFSGGAMDGDIALCEAAHSLEEFFHLVSLGVPFPHNTYGEFPGYQTDHDSRRRASSIGPYTSKAMTEALEREAFRKGIALIDKTRVIKILCTAEGGGNGENGGGRRAFALLCLGEGTFTLYPAKNIIFAGGGTPGLFRRTVYPPEQFGSSGILAREGVRFANITEWQYGIGSVKFRWNLSGSYQQAIPRYLSIDEGGHENEFLNGYYSSTGELAAAVFRKGYQWPFSAEKTGRGGSSIIDIAVYIERRLKGRRVYLDFTRNPRGDNRIGNFDLAAIGGEARDYLSRSGALGATPLERLERLNPPALELYRSKGIDLENEYLEIDVLPQHHNGGAELNIWWETSVKHLFAVGECAGSHGARRPGGSALNAGQVGGLRAASYIAGFYLKNDPWFGGTAEILQRAADELAAFEGELACRVPGGGDPDNNNDGKKTGEKPSIAEKLRRLQDLNSGTAGILRNREETRRSLARIEALERETLEIAEEELDTALKYREILLLSRLLHRGIGYYLDSGGLSRGSFAVAGDAVIGKANTGDAVALKSQAERGFATDTAFQDKALITFFDPKTKSVHSLFRPVRPIPSGDLWFEKVWADYRTGAVFRTK
ncbi:MAG: FAD-binding protein [Treponema sp.]|jgi:succinate dehydrogenase/fumarate reductase flavoprotein subunit|nr:FAD-binding protein [Treponema sp.]